jgi:DNA-binding transcriptional regulator YdaS (Cro superfamily)
LPTISTVIPEEVRPDQWRELRQQINIGQLIQARNADLCPTTRESASLGVLRQPPNAAG